MGGAEALGEPGVVDQDIDGGEIRGQCLDRGCHRSAVANIERDGMGVFAPEFVGKRGQAFRAPTQCNDARTVSRKAPRDMPPKTRRCAGHEHDHVFPLLNHRLRRHPKAGWPMAQS